MNQPDARPAAERCPCREGSLRRAAATGTHRDGDLRDSGDDQQNYDAHLVEAVLFGLRGLTSGRVLWVITGYGSALTLAVRAASDVAGGLLLAVMLSALLFAARTSRQRRGRGRGKGPRPGNDQ